jgi:hypothetical protein
VRRARPRISSHHPPARRRRGQSSPAADLEIVTVALPAADHGTAKPGTDRPQDNNHPPPSAREGPSPRSTCERADHPALRPQQASCLMPNTRAADYERLENGGPAQYTWAQIIHYGADRPHVPSSSRHRASPKGWYPLA